MLFLYDISIYFYAFCVKVLSQLGNKKAQLWLAGRANWEAELWLEVDALSVRYLSAAEDGADITRTFKYSLSRHDLEDAIFSGP